MAANVCCNIKTLQMVDHKIASANLQRKLINPCFFPFQAEQKGKIKVHGKDCIANTFSLSVLCPEVTEYMHRVGILTGVP